MSRLHRYILFSGVVFALLLISLLVCHPFCKKARIEQYNSVDRLARVQPDYCDVVIPPNIAALNFIVQEHGKEYYVKIYSKEGEPIEVFSRKPGIVIPEKSWHGLLNRNKGNQLCFEIFVRNQDNVWCRFNRITNKIANEDIDNFLVYRKMHPTDSRYTGHTGVYQRDLRSYDEKLILGRDYLGKEGCTNCHAFRENNPGTMIMGIRSATYGTSTLFIHDGKVDKIGAKFGFSSWHPSGKLVVYSFDDLPMFFHSARTEIRDTVDMDAFLSYYDVKSETVKTIPGLSGKDRLTTWPFWSADGKYLYFCSAPKLWTGRDKIPPDRYQEVKYDLVRMSYDISNDQWGQVETIVSSGDTGQSIGMPRTSPDGRWLSFCMFDYGFFSTWQKSSDLFLIDLKSGEQTGQYVPRRLECSSEESESWHSWSSNSRWIVFSSKRDYGVFTRLYISYIDEKGTAYKAFLLPQQDPFLYSSYLRGYNTPELIKEPVLFSGENLARAVRSSEKISVDLPITMATPKAKDTSGKELRREHE